MVAYGEETLLIQANETKDKFAIIDWGQYYYFIKSDTLRSMPGNETSITLVRHQQP